MTVARASAGSTRGDAEKHTNGSRLLTAQEVGWMLGDKTARWVLGEARAGRIPHVRLGRSVRFRFESIDAWVRKQERGPVPGSEPGGLSHE